MLITFTHSFKVILLFKPKYSLLFYIISTFLLFLLINQLIEWFNNFVLLNYLSLQVNYLLFIQFLMNCWLLTGTCPFLVLNVFLNIALVLFYHLVSLLDLFAELCFNYFEFFLILFLLLFKYIFLHWYFLLALIHIFYFCSWISPQILKVI